MHFITMIANDDRMIYTAGSNLANFQIFSVV